MDAHKTPLQEAIKEAESISFWGQLSQASQDQLMAAARHVDFLQQMGIKTLDAKYLAKDCWEGCQSLVLSDKLESLHATHGTLLVALDYNRKERDDLKAKLKNFGIALQVDLAALRQLVKFAHSHGFISPDARLAIDITKDAVDQLVNSGEIPPQP